jgi:hypothetical protein
MTCIFHEQRCIGFMFARGRGGIKAFDADGYSLGVFTEERDAISAIFNHTNFHRNEGGNGGS